ncbi:MAG: hypothetical protein HY246_01020 [Proteobacteria bacterium]|nr:hypothetical protein [Pseudomonadota bacterium]
MTQAIDAIWSKSAGNDRRVGSPLVLAVLAAWFLIVLAAGATGVFLAAPSQPPLPLLIAVAGPPLLFGLAYRASRRMRDFALGIDLRLITALQGWRVLGAMFLVLYAYGLLPGLFAFPAGLGDAAVGVAAPFVLMAILANGPNWRRRVLWLNVGGLLDFAGAVGTGVLTSNTALGFFAGTAARASLGELPLSLIPTFAVPLWIILHIIALLQLRRSAVGGHVDT